MASIVTRGLRAALQGFLLLQTISTANCFFTMSQSSSAPGSIKLVYGIPNSGWTSSSWNWGYASGTGHECAAICRKMYTTRQQRSELVQYLVDAPNTQRRDRRPRNFEEVKLVLALAWQRGRWDGSDGGKGGYGEVLEAMAEAKRYEMGTEEENSRLLVEDMQKRYRLLVPLHTDLVMMQSVFDTEDEDVDAALRRSSGLVLKSMGFIENGL
jgi:hypothetical protein